MYIDPVTVNETNVLCGKGSRSLGGPLHIQSVHLLIPILCRCYARYDPVGRDACSWHAARYHNRHNIVLWSPISEDIACSPPVSKRGLLLVTIGYAFGIKPRIRPLRDRISSNVMVEQMGGIPP